MEPRTAEKTLNPNPPAGTPVPASVVVLKLQDYGRLPVAEQARLKGELEALAAKALEPLAAAERIVLDAPDALAVVVLQRPQAALELAERCEAAAGMLPLCVGINHGPVRQANDPLRGTGLVGDGIAAGMVLAKAATPGRLLASRPFHEALEASSSRRAADLATAGELTDASVRRHELYALKPKAAASGGRRALVIVGIGALAIAGAALVAHRFRFEPRLEFAPAPPRKLAAHKAPPPPPPQPAAITFQIKPRGDVFIDGVDKGRTPPLSRIEIGAGAHTIEVRDGKYPPLKLTVNLSEAEEITITHTFATPRPHEEGLVQKWRRKLDNLVR
jgi:PEGA domain